MVARVGALEYEKETVFGRLARLGLVQADLEFVLRGADAAARMWTGDAPPIMPGLVRWGKTAELLRRRLRPRGWLQVNLGGLPRTLSPEGDVAIIATAGDGGTGLPGASPTNQYPKGAETARAIGHNLQLTLDLGEMFSTRGVDLANVDTWLLLYYAESDKVRAELSLPRGITARGYISSWQERILLPPIELPEFDVADGWATPSAAGLADVPVAVEKRQLALSG